MSVCKGATEGYIAGLYPCSVAHWRQSLSVCFFGEDGKEQGWVKAGVAALPAVQESGEDDGEVGSDCRGLDWSRTWEWIAS